ncbi:UNVERIFIED_CONTAM: replication initiator protein A [Streptococcus canis]
MKRISIEQVQTSERFYKIPKAFSEMEKYKKMSVDAKYMYSLLRDRYELSVRNKWVDSAGHVYIIFTIEELQELMNYGKNKIIKIKKELNANGLLEEERQGLNKPNLLYLGNLEGDEKLTNPLPEAEVPNINFQKFTKETSKSLYNKSFELSDSNSNDTDISDTDWSDGNSSRKVEKISPPASADTSSQSSKSSSFIQPQYYSLLQIIADRYNDRLFCFPDVVTMTHRQKMKVGEYLESGYVRSDDVLSIIDRIPESSQSPLAYLYKSLDNLKEERRLEQKLFAHQMAQQKYGEVG